MRGVNGKQWLTERPGISPGRFSWISRLMITGDGKRASLRSERPHGFLDRAENMIRPE